MTITEDLARAIQEETDIIRELQETLEPGRPGDLMMIFAECAKMVLQIKAEMIEEVKEDGPSADQSMRITAQLARCAHGARQALSVWLGETPEPSQGNVGLVAEMLDEKMKDPAVQALNERASKLSLPGLMPPGVAVLPRMRGEDDTGWTVVWRAFIQVDNNPPHPEIFCEDYDTLAGAEKQIDDMEIVAAGAFAKDAPEAV